MSRDAPSIDSLHGCTTSSTATAKRRVGAAYAPVAAGSSRSARLESGFRPPDGRVQPHWQLMAGITVRLGR